MAGKAIGLDAGLGCVLRRNADGGVDVLQGGVVTEVFTKADLQQARDARRLAANAVLPYLGARLTPAPADDDPWQYGGWDR